MKKTILLLLLLLPVALLLAQTDSSAYQGKAGIADVAEDDPDISVMMLMLLLGVGVAIIISLVVAGMVALFIFLLTVAGILSVSVFMGWYKRSIYTGVKWFVYLSFSIAGIAGVSLVCLLLHRFRDMDYSLKTLLSWGIPAGLIGGLLAGWVVLTVARAVYRHFVAKRELQGNV